MPDTEAPSSISPWWRHAAIVVLIVGFTVLIWLAARVFWDAPPIPARVIGPAGRTIFTREDILSGQEVFLSRGLMENGTIWGHGAYLGPDFSAEYLHALASEARRVLAKNLYRRDWAELTSPEQAAVNAELRRSLKTNRYDAQTDTLRFTEAEAISFEMQKAKWKAYFSTPRANGGLPAAYIEDPEALNALTAFFAWTAWASVASRPGKDYSYTNNFPYDPDVGNRPTSEAVLWSALSLITLLAGTAAVLFLFGRFDFLGWKSEGGHVHPQLVPGGCTTESQRATVKFFVIVALLFLAQTLVGGATAHYRADPGSFYGFDLSTLLPSNIVRTWHLQLAIFWIATSYVAGGLFLAPAIGGKEPAGQRKGVDCVFIALLLVVVGSLCGELAGIHQALGKLWFWFGHQGWEYLDLGRGWQILLAAALAVWVFLLFRGIAPARKHPKDGAISSLFLYAAIAIPLFYLPAMFFDSTSHFSVVDTWRFWIIHLWVEGFFELFATVMIAVIFYKLGLVSHTTATRVVYLDAILYLGSGIIGTDHHWYWTGQSSMTMALGAMFSAMEVVPLTLLTLDAWDFVKLTQGECDICRRKISVPHKWTFYFLIAVGFWNFVGAGIFGFLINLPVVSYFEVGTMLTPNHAHAAMMGVFGMLAVALMVFVFREVLADSQWAAVERYFRVSFWGLNIGLALMVATTLFPGGVLQLLDALNHGYWHARSSGFAHQRVMEIIEWSRLPGDLIFIVFGVIPACGAAVLTYRHVNRRNDSAL